TWLCLIGIRQWPLESQPDARHLKVQGLPTVLPDCILHALTCAFFNEDHDASAAASTAHFCRACSLLPGGTDQFVDQRSADPRSVGATQFPLFVQQALDVIPSGLLQSTMHRLRNARDLGEVPNDVFIAVNVLLEDFPIVDPRLTRRAGV